MNTAEAHLIAAQALNTEIEEAFGVHLKPIARIEQWNEVYGCLIGKIISHPRQDEFNLPLQMTTQIVNRGEGWVETENTRYILGTKGEVE